MPTHSAETAIDLSAAVPGERRLLDTKTGRISYYADGLQHAASRIPLLLIHSVNAAASAYEIRPLYQYYRRRRPVIALDLPGYGFSERGDRLYTPRLMTDALLAVLEETRRLTGSDGVDALALSLSCEFLARAAFETPESFRSLALVSPTGFSGDQVLDGPPGSTRARPWVRRTVAGSDRVGRGLFRALTSRPSVRFFLEKTWGDKQIDEGAFEYACATARIAGARHAPFCFLSGYLFSADIHRVYDALEHPIWMAHGSRGDFTDYRRKHTMSRRPNWRIQTFDTGALPHFEILDRFVREYDQFLNDTDAQPRRTAGIERRAMADARSPA